MAEKEGEVRLSAEDFEMDAEGNLRLKNIALAEQLLRLLTQAKPAAKTRVSKGPKVKVEI